MDSGPGLGDGRPMGTGARRALNTDNQGDDPGPSRVGDDRTVQIEVSPARAYAAASTIPPERLGLELERIVAQGDGADSEVRKADPSGADSSDVESALEYPAQSPDFPDLKPRGRPTWAFPEETLEVRARVDHEALTFFRPRYSSRWLWSLAGLGLALGIALALLGG